MEVKNIYRELEKVTPDEKAGIKMDKLTGDETISTFVAEIAEQKRENPTTTGQGSRFTISLKAGG